MIDWVIAYDTDLRAAITHNIAAHTRHTCELDGRRHAAVAIVIVDSDAERDGVDDSEVDIIDLSVIPSDVTGLDGRMTGVAGGASFLLCRRAAGLRAHSRQWALPGGRCDPGETVEQTALRELHEELGLDLSNDAVLGLLDDYPTRSGYVITPVVIWGGGDVELHPSPDEVERVFRIGLHELCRTDSPRFVQIPESEFPVVQVPLGGDLIHAPTGAVLVQFRWVAIEGRTDERVHTFEQPLFAWK
jgi:8-oxo-dGTP pyrophosphatase MutT (NUDIX family)